MELQTTHRRPSRWLLPMIAAAILSPFLLIPAGMLEHTARGASNILGTIGLVGIFVGFLGAVVAARTRNVRDRVGFGPEGVRLGETLVPRADIGDAVLVPAKKTAKAYVEVRSKRGGVLTCVDVADDAQGKAALHALGLGAAEKVARFDCMTPRGSFTTKMSLGLVALGVLLGGMVFALNAPWLFAVVLPLWLAASVIRPASLLVGADGLRIKGRAEDTFIPWKDIAGVEPYARGVIVKRTNGAPSLLIPVGSSPVQYGWEKDVINGIVERAREAREVHASGKPVNAEAWLVRGTRSMEEWRRVLFGDREETFRENALRDDDLWNVLEDPRANAGARGAAAALLGNKADDAARARIRIAADACAGQRLRVALDRAATGASEEELAQALEEIEEVEQARSAS